MSKRRVLAISSDLEQLRRIVATLERAGAEVDAARSPEAIGGDVIPHRYVFYSAAGGNLDALKPLIPRLLADHDVIDPVVAEIGRASCRERV